jgi:hypothetical protein
MKDEEDEAFDELAKKQGSWGGGFPAKRAMAADKLQEPVLDLDGHVVGKVRKPQPVQEPWNEDEWRKNNWRCQHGWLRGEQCEICNASPAPKPAQEPVSFPCCGYTDAIKWNQFNGVVQCHMCGQVYTASPAAQQAHCQCTACKDGILHASDCAVHNGPAYPAGPCDCGPTQPADNPYGYDWSMLEAAQESLREHMARIKELEAQLARPAQERDFSCKVCGNKPNSDGELEHGKGCYTQDENGGGSEFISDAVTAPQPAQEPVEYQMLILGGRWTHCAKHIYDAAADKSIVRALYTTPPKREWVGLTDDALADIWYKESLDWMEFARVHEAALKEKNT